MQIKQCNGPCGRELPCTPEFFYRKVDGAGGVRSKCKQCEESLRKGASPPVSLADAPPPPTPRGYVPGAVPPLPLSPRSTVVVLGDMHMPWHHKKALSLAIELIRLHQPDVVVQVGDALDQFAASKYPRSHNIMTPAEEFERGRAYHEFMWRQVLAASPSTTCYQLLGNHDDRAMKRIAERAPELAGLLLGGIRDLYTFDGVTTVHDSSEELVIDDVVYIHGFLQFGQHARRMNRSCVTGHLHKGGVQLMEEGRIWELNAGWLGDVAAPVYGYHQLKRFHGTTLGIGWVDQLGPRFIPFT